MTHYKAAAFSCSILEMAQRAFLRGTLCFAVRRLLKAALETAAAQNFAGRQSESKSRLIAEFRDQIAVLRAKRPRPSWEAIAELMRPALDASPDT